jgi:hypothetical protein
MHLSSLNSLSVIDAEAINDNRDTENKNPLYAVSNNVQSPTQVNINTNNATTGLADIDNNTSFATSAKLIAIKTVKR